MNLTETAVNVDVDSAGMVERQTKGITIYVRYSVLKLFHVELRCKVTDSKFTTGKLNLRLLHNFLHLIPPRRSTVRLILVSKPSIYAWIQTNAVGYH